jgi:hypothetical protein
MATPKLTSQNVTTTSGALTLPNLGGRTVEILLTNHSDTDIYVNIDATATAAVGGGYKIASGGDQLTVRINGQNTVNAIHGGAGNKRLEISVNAD